MDGKAKTQCPAPSVVHGHQLQSDFLIKVDGPVGERDPIAETVPSGGLSGVGIQAYVLAFGLGVETWGLSNGQDRAPIMATGGQCVARPIR